MSTILKTLATLALSLAVLIIASTTVTAQETKSTKKKEKLSPVGSWTWEQEFGGSKIKSELTVDEKDGKFSGNYKDQDRDLEIKNGKLEDGKFSFEVFPHEEQPEFALKFEGKLSADAMKGTMNYSMNNEAKSVAWTASRVDSMNAVFGKWLVEFETPDGNALEFKIQTLKKGKNGLAVKFLDEKTAKVRNVKFKEGVLTFDSSQVYEEQPISVEWNFKINGDQLIGTLYYMFDNSEDEGELEVSGMRVK